MTRVKRKDGLPFGAKAKLSDVPPSMQGHGLLSHSAVLALLGGVSRKQLLGMERAGRFPRRIFLNPTTVVWKRSEVEGFLQDPEGWIEAHRGQAA